MRKTCGVHMIIRCSKLSNEFMTVWVVTDAACSAADALPTVARSHVAHLKTRATTPQKRSAMAFRQFVLQSCWSIVK